MKNSKNRDKDRSFLCYRRLRSRGFRPCTFSVGQWSRNAALKSCVIIFHVIFSGTINCVHEGRQKRGGNAPDTQVNIALDRCRFIRTVRYANTHCIA